MKQDQDWWAITALHESAHGIVAFALNCHPVELNLNRRTQWGDMAAGDCLARYEHSWFGKFASIFTQNAPFIAHQYECLPCGEKGDLHERTDAYAKFCKLIGSISDPLFRKLVDEPLLRFFADTDIQAGVLVLANKLYNTNKVSMKQVGYWRKLLKVPDNPCEALSEACLALAKAVGE